MPGDRERPRPRHEDEKKPDKVCFLASPALTKRIDAAARDEIRTRGQWIRLALEERLARDQRP